MPEKKYEHFKEICQGGGLKVTSQRFIIFETLEKVSCHPTADQLYDLVNKKLPSISRDTVYRTLNMLAERGLARKLTTPGGAARFDGDLDPHHHFLCERCDVVFDIDWPEFSTLRWPENVHQLGHPRQASVLISGICHACRGGREPN